MPLQFDMPFGKLALYEGTNPRPVNFDEYWQTALAELQALEAQVEIVSEKEFQAPFVNCSHLWFTGVGGARMHAKLLQPRQLKAPHPAVLMFHGYNGSSGSWMDKLAYAAAGFTVAALDCRGQGGLSEDVGGVKGPTHTGHIIRGLDDAPEKLLYRSHFLDAAQLAGIVMGLEGVDSSRVGAMGGSQGGGLALACAALVPGINRTAVVHPFLCDYQRAYELDPAGESYSELKMFFQKFDPQHLREREIFTRLGYIDVQHLVSRIRARVLMATCLSDTACPPSTQFAAYNKITSEKSLKTYPDHGHVPPPGFDETVFGFMMEM